MADARIVDITEDTTPDATDVIYASDSTGTEDKRVQLANLPVSTPVQVAIAAAIAAQHTTDNGTYLAIADADERARDAIGAALVAGANVTVTVSDGADTITIACTSEAIQDVVGAFVAAGTGITATYDDAANTLTIATTITQYTDEMARDALGAALTAGANVTLTVNDGADTITVAVTTEAIQDVLGAILAASGSGITVTYDDSGNTETIALSAALQDLHARWTVATETVGSKLAFREGTNNGTNEAVVKAADSLAVDVTVTLPSVTGELVTLPISPATYPPEAGGYIGSSALGSAFNGASMGSSAANAHQRLYFVPVFIPAACTVDRIGLSLFNAADAGSVLRFGIYLADGSRGEPGTLLLDAGTVAADGGSGHKEITINQTLAARAYWLAVVWYGGVPTTRPTASLASSSTVCWGKTNNSGSDFAELSQASVSGSLPSTANATWTSGSSLGGLPKITLRTS